MKREIKTNTIIVGDFNSPLTPVDRSTKQKLSKETQTLNDTMDQLDIIDMYRTFQHKPMNFTFFSSAHRTFSRIDDILGHKSSLGKFKIIESKPLQYCKVIRLQLMKINGNKKKLIESISSIFCDHNAVRLDVNYREKNY